jgi:tetraacyldisaccharide 4'-kinase
MWFAQILLTPILAPLSYIFRAIVCLRDIGYSYKLLKIYRSKLPVISIGNITVGGNGKTPLAIALAHVLRAESYNPVILSRGYGGSEYGPSIVLPHDLSQSVGDEPKLMAMHGCVVVVSKNKVDGIKFIERRQLGDLVILDDGFQSRSIHRDIDIIAIECSQEGSVREISSGRLLPWGRLREPLGSILKRAALVVLNVGAGSVADLVRAEGVKKLIKNFRNFHTAKVITKSIVGVRGVGALAPCRVNLLTSIARPEKVVSTVEQLGFKVEQRLFFADHHKYTVPQVQNILNESELPVVCTEKDAVKLIELKEVRLERVFVAPISLDINPDILPALIAKVRSKKL